MRQLSPLYQPYARVVFMRSMQCTICGEKVKWDDQAMFGSAGGKKVKWLIRLCLVECKIWEGRG